VVARYASPDCDHQFLELSKGRLFLLPPLPDFRESPLSVPRLIDHCYWLCPECASTHTITLEGPKAVVTRVQKICGGQVAAQTCGSSTAPYFQD
jgi:hypothetical protein